MTERERILRHAKRLEQRADGLVGDTELRDRAREALRDASASLVHAADLAAGADGFADCVLAWSA